MPYRKVPLITEQIYHVYNRGIDRRDTFNKVKDYQRAIAALEYYRVAKPPISLSRFISLPQEQQQEMQALLHDAEHFNVEILAFCLMPNHFHLLLKQLADGGISRFTSQLENSYTRSSNIKNKRQGPLFLTQFCAVRIENDEQLVHVSRYIHLNPFTGFIITRIEDLKDYQWSSFPAYIDSNIPTFCNTEYILSQFKDNASYQQFVYDQADYQRQLGVIKHLLLEDK